MNNSKNEIVEISYNNVEILDTYESNNDLISEKDYDNEIEFSNNKLEIKTLNKDKMIIGKQDETEIELANKGDKATKVTKDNKANRPEILKIKENHRLILLDNNNTVDNKYNKYNKYDK